MHIKNELRVAAITTIVKLQYFGEKMSIADGLIDASYDSYL